MKILLLMILFIRCLCFAEIDPQAYLSEMHEHRNRIKLLATDLIQDYQEFSILKSDLVLDYLDLHDLPKLMKLRELKLFSFKANSSIYKVLSKNYGHRINLSENTELSLVILELNRIEEILKNDFFEINNVNSNKKELLKWLEKIVDITDTGMHRQNEMGIINREFDGSIWLLQSGDEKASKLSEAIERKFRLSKNKQILLDNKCRNSFY